MDLGVDIKYNQVLKLARQLPKKDLRKLTTTLLSEVNTTTSSKSFQELILQAPTWSDIDFEYYNKAREQINKSRIV
jgi:predicted HTH transcriptional regulator